MNKKFAIVMALFMALAGCTESIEDEIKDMVVIPGCDDSTAINYDENATNSEACLTELGLEQAIMNFMTEIEEFPKDASSSTGVSVISTSSDGMSASTEMVFTPNGAAIFTSMSGEMDIGGMMMPLSFISEQTVIPNPDGTDTTVIHMVYNDETQEFTMDNAVPWSVVVADMMADDDDDHDDDMGGDHGDDGHGDEMVCYDMSTHTVDSSYDNQADCESAGLMWTAASGGPGGHDDHGDDDMDMGGDMGMSAPESPDPDEILDGFDVINSTYAMSLSTTSGYSFSASMEETYYDEDGNESTMTSTFTFVLDSTFKVTSISATNDMESMTVTLLSDAEIAGYFGDDWSPLPTEALPFAVMPMDGGHDDHDDDGDHGDHDDGDHGDHDDDMPSEEDMFEMADSNDDGFVNMSDIESLFSDDHDDHDDDDEPPTPEEAMENDTDGSGGISWSEFYVAWEDSNAEDVADGEDNMTMEDDPVLESDLHQAFNDSDADGDGELDLTELGTFIDELENMFGSDDDHDERTFHCSSTIGGTPDTEIPFSQVNDGTEDCGDGSDEPQDTDGDGTVDNWFDCMDGSTVSMELVNDGTDDCPDGDDEVHDDHGDHDDGLSEEILSLWFNAADSDSDGLLSESEFSVFYSVFDEDGPPIEIVHAIIDIDNDGEVTGSEYSDYVNLSGFDADTYDWDIYVMMIEMYDSDDSGGLSVDELSELPGFDDDDHDGHGDGGHDGHDHAGHMHGPLDWIIVEADMSMPPIAGDLSNYYAVLSKCTIPDDDSDDGDMMMDMGGAPEMDCGPDIVFTPLSSANDPNAIFFHDTDSSGTLTFGDMIHVNESVTSEEWTHVRLYSASADAYSDENPMLAPGFTGVIGMIALLGAALLTRRD